MGTFSGKPTVSIQQNQRSYHQEVLARTLPACRMVKLLGKGGEGTVYLLKDARVGSRTVVKLYHTPIPRNWVVALETIANRFQPNSVGLEDVKLIENGDLVEGVFYPYQPLYPVHYRLLDRFDTLAQAIFAAACRLQAHLLANYQVVIFDTIADHFLLDRQGRFHFIDYGFSVKPADHPNVRKFGRLEYTLAMMVLSIFNRNIKSYVQPNSEYREEGRSTYFSHVVWEPVLDRQSWVREVYSHLEQSSPEAFYHPGFYHDLVKGFPSASPSPRTTIFTSSLLHLSANSHEIALRFFNSLPYLSKNAKDRADNP